MDMLNKCKSELIEAGFIFQTVQGQFPQVQDVSNEQMVNAITEALSDGGEFPLTLVVLDEVQQYIGNDVEKA